jgi:hypothetical protein
VCPPGFFCGQVDWKEWIVPADHVQLGSCAEVEAWKPGLQIWKGQMVRVRSGTTVPKVRQWLWRARLAHGELREGPRASVIVKIVEVDFTADQRDSSVSQAHVWVDTTVPRMLGRQRQALVDTNARSGIIAQKGRRGLWAVQTGHLRRQGG